MLTRTMRRLALALVAGSVLTPPARSQDVSRERVEAEARGQAAEADRLFKKGEYAAALPLYEAERASRAALGDQRYEAYAVRAIGCCHAELGNFDDAIAAWHVARALDSKREDRGFEGYDWLLIGNIELRRGHAKEAAENLERSLPLLSQAIDRDHEADARRLLARALADLERPNESVPHLERAWTLVQDLKDPRRLADLLVDTGRVALLRGELGPAAEWLEEARAALEDQGRAADAAHADRLLADALIGLGRSDVAAARVEDASVTHARLGNTSALADDLLVLAALKAAADDLPGAQRLARKAVDAWRDADDPLGEIDALVALAHCQSLGNDWTAAATSLANALAIARREGEPADRVRLLILAADVEHRARRLNHGQAFLDEAARVADEAKEPALKQAVAQARQRFR